MRPRHSSEPSQPLSRLTLLAGGALGVVFGDIGTSPLYTFRTVLSLSEHDPTPGVILGLLSLITWTLILVTSIKYAAFAMRIDNHGEGGIMALMSLLVEKGKGGRWVIFSALIGAALIYGDGAITPAISVLSALEGLEMVIPESQPYILPLTVAVLLGLFLLQPFGTARIGKIFGPVMAVWFLAIAALGVRGIVQHPSVLLALNPAYGIAFLFSNGYTSFLVLGGVFLCVTGAEALYADMGHFGKKPIWLAWYGIVFPSLLLNYAGQSALILAGADSKQNLFYTLCPPVLQVPLIILAALATIIASQAIITGAFSMTRQAIQLGWLPRLRIKQTAAESYGQIYIGIINWLLMGVTIGLVVFFKSSDKLAAAYGIAVSLTMLMTTGLLFVAMREVWRWSLASSAVIALCFLVIDATFLFANLIKVLEGGYIPLLMAAAICTVMLIWHRGVKAVSASVGEKGVSVDAFFAQLQQKTVPRVAGSAVFLTRTQNNIPPVMRWHVARNRALQQDVLSLTIDILNVPYVGEEQRIRVEQRAPGYWHGVAQYGFMEHPDIPRLLQGVSEINALFATDDATWYVGHETIVAGEGEAGMAAWQRHIFAFMKRNCTHVINHYHLPSDRVVEISRRVAV
ncbi:TPA: KUP/HAK/KT family potassium transporter [Enterobacter asburiae]|uniref:Low affinity potassium transport system protein Kup n=1 Tax=Enterobacter asburiae TaxID=61645 RepID=A0A7W3CC44_ENTAS|nr:MULTISPECIES: KUP/HAK/KT family potassium transporter [Enterobacter]EKS7201947.1 KUP/HAK/KT family potassium transporter [Enterobacter asburiae]EKX8894880.1 KUP/HAK/KT family potassium transporter [Enterobacter asburiae]ELO0980780.1 KUP/HAK/KT family potassium transporter [Enterobacter asburiae]MBA7988119.1 KUP/HAK/KT family potassium transporter [Enterobacter asburiae]MBA8078308.1 KUP/HAK/KT family potassium transporter [Enterobacter asburiae]